MQVQMATGATSAAAIRDELAGHSTLAVMALLGMALYATTYSLIYSMTSYSAVAFLEMWMCFTHLFSALVCCVGQWLVVSLWQLQQPVPHVARTQVALFLGIACAVSVLGSSCMQSDRNGAECAIYFGAAAIPRLAAAGAIAWAWIMYAASLGCQSWNSLVSLGLSGRDPIIAAAAMAMVPLSAHLKLLTTCGGTWQALLCNPSSALADCSRDASSCVGVSAAMMATALCLVWADGIFFGQRVQKRRNFFCIVAASLILLEPYVAWAMQPTAAKVQIPFAYFLLNSAFGLLYLIRVVFFSASTTTTTTTTTTTNADHITIDQAPPSLLTSAFASAAAAASSASAAAMQQQNRKRI